MGWLIFGHRAQVMDVFIIHKLMKSCDGGVVGFLVTQHSQKQDSHEWDASRFLRDMTGRRVQFDACLLHS